jgi:hypothetical protein
LYGLSVAPNCQGISDRVAHTIKVGLNFFPRILATISRGLILDRNIARLFLATRILSPTLKGFLLRSCRGIVTEIAGGLVIEKGSLKGYGFYLLTARAFIYLLPYGWGWFAAESILGKPVMRFIPMNPDITERAANLVQCRI